MDRIEYIVAIASKVLDVPVEKIYSKSRLRIYTEPRSIITIIAREEGISWQDISDKVGRGCHSSACYSYKSGIKLMTIDKKFKQRYKEVRAVVNDSYEDFVNDDLKLRAFMQIEACLIRVKDITKNLDKELTEITALKSELNK